MVELSIDYRLATLFQWNKVKSISNSQIQMQVRSPIYHSLQFIDMEKKKKKEMHHGLAEIWNFGLTVKTGLFIDLAETEGGYVVKE